MPLIGTAGHVDHGKSTLIEKITGRDPDRWAVEKQRGLTIDLGFAWATLPDGTEVSFVDVPGHERYLKNMLAGIEAIDVALLTVAADEGWMPQSEEHLAVLDLLEVGRAVVALTKVDLVDEELLELAAGEVAEQLVGSRLHGAPVVPVSAVTGYGVGDLLSTLSALLPEPPQDTSRPRLWVDRSFPVAGAGTVVTGSLLDGSISVGDQVELLPSGRKARVRGIQSHERPHERIGPGRRVALNLAGVDHDRIARGQMVGLPGQWALTQRFTVEIRTARYVDEIHRSGAYQLHIGSSASRVALTGLADGVAMLQVEIPLPLKVGDRFVLRDTGRKLVVAGGRVLDPTPARRTREAMARSRRLDPSGKVDEIAGALLAIRSIDSVHRLSAHSGGGRPAAGQVIGDTVISLQRWNGLEEAATRLVREDHGLHPLRPGLPLATLAERLDIDPSIAGAVIDRAAGLERVGPDVALAGHQVELGDDQVERWQQAVSRLARSLAVPDERDLGIDPELIHLKVRNGELVRIAPGLVYLPDQITELTTYLEDLGDSFTVAEFRDASGLSRKYAVPFLEWSDRVGLTVRRGDTRSLR